MSTNLLSPGVEVRVVDESAYASSGPGTIPLFFLATRNNKPSPSGDGIAPGTIASQANIAYKIGSQRELLQTFGNPFFVSIEGTPVHGSELNEYGLHAAYQYLGISNQAYVIRSDIDLNQLEASVAMPTSPPLNGTYWFDLSASDFGVFRSTGASNLDPFLRQPTIVITNQNDFDETTGKPIQAIGQDGSFAVVTVEGTNRIFEKIPTPAQGSVWFNIGSRGWTMARSFVRGANPIQTVTVGNSFNINNVTFTLNSTNVNQIVIDINNTILASPILSDRTNPSSPVPHIIASVDDSGRIKFNFVLPSVIFQNVNGTPLTALGIIENEEYKSCKLYYAPHNRVPQQSTNGDVWIKTTQPNGGSKYVVRLYNSDQGQFITQETPLFESDQIATASLGLNVVPGTLYVQYNAEGTSQAPLAGAFIKRWNGQVWEHLAYEQSASMPTSLPEEGTLWYNTDFRVDIMVNDGDQWLGYRNMYPLTDKNGPTLASAAPLFQYDGSPLVDNDLWIDTKDLENYPVIYRYQANSRRWVKIDNTDQTTPFGIVFQDARINSGPQYPGDGGNYNYYSEKMEDLTRSNYLDPDAPDPRVYALGTLLFNTRYSTYNVKEWKPEWFKDGGFDPNEDFTFSTYTVGGGYWNDNGTMREIVFPALTDPGRWITASGNRTDGAPYMGRKAQRAMIVRALQATVAGNDEIRSEIMFYNLMACPGYPELIDEMVTLNTDIKEVAFILGDTPARLEPTANAVRNWATNVKNVPSNNEDGLITRNPYVALHYPWGLTTNVDGLEIMVPPSTISIRTFAYNDRVAYPWFAPAGFNRGLVTNAASVGYLNAEGEYTPTILSPGQRDTLYQSNINPIAYMPNRGLVIWGQKTLSPIETAMDRVNVARLINYLRYHLDNAGKPFIFEQNDVQTRDAIRTTFERILMGIAGLRGLQDFAVVCDDSNNTPDRIDRNELWVDVLIAPTKVVEFIVVPIRIRNTGDSLVLNF